MTASPPVCERRAHRETRHGITREDPYAWLRADNWQEVMRDPAVLADDIRTYLEAENAYTASVMAPTEALQKTLFQEMRGRIKEDDSSVPAPDGPFAYFTKYEEGSEHPFLCRERREGGDRQVLVNGNALAEGHAYFNFGGSDHSPDHRYLAYSADLSGSEYFTIRVLDTASGDLLIDEIPDTTGGMVWSADGTTLFYTEVDANHRPCRVKRHRLGTPLTDDVLVYEEADPSFFVGCGKTQSGRFIVIDAHDHQTSELRLIDAALPESAPRLIAPRDTGVEYDVEDDGERLLILTNADEAEDFKIVAAPVEAPGRENWSDVVTHEPGRLILDHVVYGGHLVRLERIEGLPRIIVTDKASGDSHPIAFDEEAYELGLAHGYEYETTTLRFSYSSMTTPAQVFDYDMASRERTLRKTQEVPSGHDPADYVTRRIFATAPDGEQVPISLLHHRDTQIDGSAPCWLYGYGSYGISIPASFSTARLSLVDRGFVFAIAHIRGGKEKGYRWYKDGRAEKKENTFRDFIAAAEHLCAEKYTARGRIIAHGGSAGGMLMGAVANMAPQLFAGIVAEVPFVDVLTTMLDADLPLTPPEWPEWGNPIESEEAYARIAGYSPYDNVSAQDYPAFFINGGLSDPRVTYWEPAKWAAKLRATKTDDNPLLLKINMEAGHGGKSGRFEHLHEIAEVYAFGLMTLGMA